MPFYHGKKTAVYLGGYDVSAYFQEATTGASADEVDVTTFGAASDDYRSYLAGFIDATLTLNGLFESTTVLSGTTTLDSYMDSIQGAETAVPVTLEVEGSGTVFMMEACELEYSINNSIGDAVKITASFKNREAAA